ncbi:MAG: lipoprotein LpqV [Mycobacterium sp.]
MRRNSNPAVRCGATVGVAALVVALAGCSSTEPSDPTAGSSAPEVATSSPTSDLPPLPAEPTPPDAVGVSPGGVTTQVDVPSDATESQYGQACHAAREWMNTQPVGDPAALAEAYLKQVQTPDAVGPGTFDTTWVQLTPAQQAGVIMAANGAANMECE